jgi:GcrA cell cycle regulator
MGQVNTFWTPEYDAALTGMIAGGLSRAQAAVALNEQFHTQFTRCATGGRVHRLKLVTPERPKPPKSAPKPPAEPRQRAPKSPPPIKPREPEATPRAAVPLLELSSDGCRWPFGEGETTLFCDSPQRVGSSYCSRHFQLSRRT